MAWRPFRWSDCRQLRLRARNKQPLGSRRLCGPRLVVVEVTPTLTGSGLQVKPSVESSGRRLRGKRLRWGPAQAFSGNDLDGKAYRQWKTWARAKMMAMKDISKAQRGPFVYCFLDGLALECVEHLKLDDIMSNDDGDGLIIYGRCWMSAFLTRCITIQMAECLRKVLQLSRKDGESMAEWTAKVTDTFCEVPQEGVKLRAGCAFISLVLVKINEQLSLPRTRASSNLPQ